MPSRKPWIVGTCVQVNRWADWKFEPYDEALLIPEAYVRQLDIHRDLGKRFGLYIAEEHSRGGWLDEDGDHNYKRIEMVGARLEYIGGEVEVYGFVEDEDKINTFGHTGIFRPQAWTEYPMSYYRKRQKK